MDCPLSQRQIKVVEKLSQGLQAKAAANDLHMTTVTVNRDIEKAMKASNTRNTTGLVATALRQGWIR